MADDTEHVIRDVREGITASQQDSGPTEQAARALARLEALARLVRRQARDLAEARATIERLAGETDRLAGHLTRSEEASADKDALIATVRRGAERGERERVLTADRMAALQQREAERQGARARDASAAIDADNRAADADSAGAPTPATLHELAARIVARGHAIDIPDPWASGAWHEATCAACGGTVSVRAVRVDAAHAPRVQADVTTDLLRPCMAREIVTFTLEESQGDAG